MYKSKVDVLVLYRVNSDAGAMVIESDHYTPFDAVSSAQIDYGYVACCFWHTSGKIAYGWHGITEDQVDLYQSIYNIVR